MAGSSSLLSLAAMAVLLVGLASLAHTPSKSPPSPSPTPHRRLLLSFEEPITEKPPKGGHKDVPDVPNIDSPPPQTPPPPPPDTPGIPFPFLEGPASGLSGAVSGGDVSGRLGFGFAGSVAIGALVAGLVI